MKPIRYQKEMVDEFLSEGYWTQELFYDFWDRNAREYGDQEALVDSKYRVTLVGKPNAWWTELPLPGFKWVSRNIHASSFNHRTVFTAFWPELPPKEPVSFR